MGTQGCLQRRNMRDPPSPGGMPRPPTCSKKSLSSQSASSAASHRLPSRRSASASSGRRCAAAQEPLMSELKISRVCALGTGGQRERPVQRGTCVGMGWESRAHGCPSGNDGLWVLSRPAMGAPPLASSRSHTITRCCLWAGAAAGVAAAAPAAAAASTGSSSSVRCRLAALCMLEGAMVRERRSTAQRWGRATGKLPPKRTWCSSGCAIERLQTYC